MSELREKVLSLARSAGMEAQAGAALRRLRAVELTLLQPLLLAGVDPRLLMRTMTCLPRFVRDAQAYSRQCTAAEPFPLRLWDLRLKLGEHNAQAGATNGHYFHADLWAARKIHEAAPGEHVDVGSRIDGFVAHLLAFMPVTIVDVRPLLEDVEGLQTITDDATHLGAIVDASLESVSSLHAVEHFGLGRYGDPVDPRAAEKAMAALARVLRPGGRLYFAVPIGRQRLQFNAHRVFSPTAVLKAFSQLTLESFAAIDDRGRLVPHAAPEDYEDADYACGLFELGREEEVLTSGGSSVAGAAGADRS